MSRSGAEPPREPVLGANGAGSIGNAGTGRTAARAGRRAVLIAPRALQRPCHGLRPTSPYPTLPIQASAAMTTKKTHWNIFPNACSIPAVSAYTSCTIA